MSQNTMPSPSEKHQFSPEPTDIVYGRDLDLNKFFRLLKGVYGQDNGNNNFRVEVSLDYFNAQGLGEVTQNRVLTDTCSYGSITIKCTLRSM